MLDALDDVPHHRRRLLVLVICVRGKQRQRGAAEAIERRRCKLGVPVYGVVTEVGDQDRYRLVHGINVAAEPRHRRSQHPLLGILAVKRLAHERLGVVGPGEQIGGSTARVSLSQVPARFAAVVAQVSDLVASALKRDAQVKDSGTTVPGIGGVIDLIDSPFGVAPVGYWLI